MYIGKVLLTDEWQDVEALVKELDGQSSFAFGTEDTYIIQQDSQTALALLAVAASADSLGTGDGLQLGCPQSAEFKGESGMKLFAKRSTPAGGAMSLIIAKAG